MMNDETLTHEEATFALTLIDSAVRANGLGVDTIPGGFAVLGTLVKKLSACQDADKINQGK
jgi:hypothetical protein